MPLIQEVGSATVIALEDGSGPFFSPRAKAFPSARDDDWARADALDPGARTADGEWLLRFRCFAIRLDSGETVLVDAGIGPADAPAAAWAPVPGRLPDELAAAGIGVDDVTTVVITHLHTDHVGWAVVADRPYFPNARYVLQQAEADVLKEVTAELSVRLLAPLREAGQLDLVEGTARLAPGVSTVATPGHTPGHQCVRLDTGREPMLFTGDLLVHAIQLIDPEMGYIYESDPALARESRVRVLDELAAVGGALATAHLTDAFRRLA
jgi:glyoxylase-like metal-dependent hydrolase (beta-lactamase superfamily II)